MNFLGLQISFLAPVLGCGAAGVVVVVMVLQQHEERDGM